jgi:hypothetical protein
MFTNKQKTKKKNININKLYLPSASVNSNGLVMFGLNGVADFLKKEIKNDN